MNKIAIIIVAGGSSSRMKGPKQLLPFRETTLLGNAIEQAKKSEAREVFVVLGANSEEIKANLDISDIQLLENTEWEEGIGSSIATGIRYITENGGFEGVLLMLADQPLIDSHYLNRMIAKFRKDPSKIVATKYPKSTGVPALFPKEYFPQLLLLKGDTGAKSLLNGNDSSVMVLDAGTKIMDVDTPEDYRNLSKR